MLKIKKGARFSSFLFTLTILSLGGVIYGVTKDFFLSPMEQFQIAQQADFNGEFKRAERFYLLSERSKDISVSRLSSYYLGMLYKKNEAKGMRDFEASKQFLTRSAELGLPQAQYELALLYDTGDKIKENRKQALFWMKKAADAGFVEAEYAYGVYLDRGYEAGQGISQAILYYEKAANKGHQRAIKGLALIYKMGAEGIAPDVDKSAFWMNKVLK